MIIDHPYLYENTKPLEQKRWNTLLVFIRFETIAGTVTDPKVFKSLKSKRSMQD